MIVTLGSSSVFKGFMQGTLESRQLAVIPEGMANFGRSALFVATNPESGLTSRMPTAFIVFVVVLAAAWFILNRTMFGAASTPSAATMSAPTAPASACARPSS